eukprot:m.149997 g.149997  ORF g.149997 m.149997 type:complete len:677 (-) comp30700_c0_seq4:116-2146(-)
MGCKTSKVVPADANLAKMGENLKAAQDALALAESKTEHALKNEQESKEAMVLLERKTKEFQAELEQVRKTEHERQQTAESRAVCSINRIVTLQRQLSSSQITDIQLQEKGVVAGEREDTQLQTTVSHLEQGFLDMAAKMLCQNAVYEAEKETMSSAIENLHQRSAIRTVNLLHFNDIYSLEPTEHEDPIGGASRFKAAVESAKEHMQNPIIVFSGDFVGPSLDSIVTQGNHNKQALDCIGVHFGCLGNHEFDFGAKNLEKLLHGYAIKDHIVPPSNVEWIATNINGADGNPVAGCHRYRTIIRNDVKIGFLGLAENWVDNLPIEKGYAVYLDVFEEGEKFAKQLKKDEGCDLVIALTHARLEVDLEITAKCPSIDLLLGGHNHFYKQNLQKRLIKSGADWKYLSKIAIDVKSDGSHTISNEVDSILEREPKDHEMDKLIESHKALLNAKFGKVIGTAGVALDPTEEVVRFKEGYVPQFMMDVTKTHIERNRNVRVDFCLIQGAAIKGKRKIDVGSGVNLGDIHSWTQNVPFEVFKMTGNHIKSFLEALVKILTVARDNECFSFPHCSDGIKFDITISNAIGNRISNIRIGSALTPINAEETYHVGLQASIFTFDKIPEMRSLERVVDEENSVLCAVALQKWFAEGRDADEDLETNTLDGALRTVVARPSGDAITFV